MIGRILGAAIGHRLAGPDRKREGTLIGFLAPAIARRLTGPLGLALVGGYAAKKILDRRRARRA